MRARIIFLGLLSVLCVGGVVSAEPRSDAPMRGFDGHDRMRPMDRMGGEGRGPFSFRLAGLATSVGSTFASNYLSADDIATAKTLIQSCSVDISDFCKDLSVPAEGSPMMDWFPYYVVAARCLTEKADSVSAACKEAAQVTADYMREHRETLMPALKKVSAMDAFSFFQTSCAEPLASAPACFSVGDADVTSGVSTVVGAPFEGRRQQGWSKRSGRPREGGFRHGGRALRQSDVEGNGNDFQHDVQHVTELSAALGACVAAVVPSAEGTCARAIHVLGRVSGFATRAAPERPPRDGRPDHGEGRHLLGALDEPDAPQEFPEPDSKYLAGSVVKPTGPVSSEGDSTSEEESERSGNEGGWGRHSGEEESGFFRHHGGRHHREEAGGFVGFVLLVSVVVLSVALCRRRRVIRQLRDRIAQLEGGGRAVPTPMPYPASVASYPGLYPGVYPAMYPGGASAAGSSTVVGIPMPPASHASAPQQRTASDAVEENSSLLQRSHAPQIVQPYPGQFFTYPTATVTHAL